MTEATPHLRPLATDLWEVEQHVHAGGVHVRRRMTVVRLADGGVWLHSPVDIDARLAEQIAGVGPVEHIVAPNLHHHLHVAAARRRYPGATLWAAPGLAHKRRDIAFDHTLGETEPPWQADLASSHMQGAPMFNEFVFHHRSTRTLICTDALFNIRDEPSLLTRLLFRGMGIYQKFTQSRVWRWNTRDPRAMAAAIDRVLAWDITRVVPAHGDVVEDVDPARLRAAFGR